MKYTTAIPRQIRKLVRSGLVLGSLSACTNPSSLPPCPNIFALSDARQFDHFHPGGGTKLNDIEYAVRIDDWKGSCGYKQRDLEWDVNVDMQVSFTVKRGPANVGGAADFQYFAAIPVFYPKPEAKKSIPVTIKFPDGVDTVQYTGVPISMTFPVKGKEVIDNYTIYLGLQMTQDEVARNRRDK